MTGIEIAAALALFGGAAGAVGAIREGNVANTAAKYEAKQLETAGDQAFSEGQQRASLARREGKLALGRARAMGAASGAGTNDAIEERIREQADYNAMVEFYGGESQKNKFYASSYNTRTAGKNAKTASYFKAVSSLTGSGSSIYDTYNK